MKTSWLGIFLLLPSLTACEAPSKIKINSAQITPEQAKTIETNIQRLHPNASLEEQQQIADVAVKAIENLLFVEGGSFDMGDFKAPCEIPSRTKERMDWSPEHTCYSMFSDGGEINLHKVTLDSYSIAKFETTYADMEVMRKVSGLPVADQNLDGTPRVRGSEYFKEWLEKRGLRAARTKEWENGKNYCQWLGTITALPFDLPTEAQWEYAARSRGQHYYFATNNGYRQVLDGGYYNHETGYRTSYTADEVNASSRITNVDTFPPNPLGVYGMSNQVSEWVNDWYAKDYYLHAPEHNPQGPESGTEKVLRDARGVTMTFSRMHSAGFDSYEPGISFRCALQQTAPVKP
ncbi:formylglycine-generating enzyme family protein [Vibrio sp. C8]